MSKEGGIVNGLGSKVISLEPIVTFSASSVDVNMLEDLFAGI